MQRSGIRKLWQGPGYELAAAIEALIAAGHDSTAVWKLTPRQISAYQFLAERRRERENANMFGVVNLATNGEPDKMRKQLDEWGDQ